MAAGGETTQTDGQGCADVLHRRSLEQITVPDLEQYRGYEHWSSSSLLAALARSD
jgi:hypothetical protein